VSALDQEGQPFYWPEADAALFAALRRHARPPVELVELDAHINDPEFALALSERLLQMVTAQREAP
jgi:uncharacterized protein (UPF0261 family)